MKRLKLITIILVFIGGAVFIFTPNIVPENFPTQQVLSMASDSDVIIIFNSGGWGNTPLEKAEDFAPVINGIQETLKGWGYDSIVVPYNRTKNSFLGKISSSRDFLTSFDFSSENLAQEVDFLAESFPGKKIILAGLSNGSTLANRTYEKVSVNVRGSVYTIAAGAPFWVKTSNSDNVLQINNNGKDTLAKGDVKNLLIALIKTPFKWIFSKINGQNLTIAQASHAYGHDYSWSSPEINSQIIGFLENKFAPQD
ncbi:MAG: hypothetical protein NTZ84_00440 [Candidatus Nealsonbacteria bacterium]|nr:hypothetical protein [Candidatus Nealsonbacteria bacterium]